MFDGVYLLGSFAQYATVYAQQVRALNLVDALAKCGRMTDSSRIAVIGGGIGGLTAASAAAVKGAAHVQVIEKRDQTMRVQRSARSRWIHPHIYDWPFKAETADMADLPLMPWRADTASNVVEQLDRSWQKLRDEHSTTLADPQLGVEDTQVRSSATGMQVRVNGTWHDYDIVIVAIGFGLDDDFEHAHSYWTDAPWDGPEHDDHGSSFLVSGAGDGALTDLMRLCFLDFRHSRVIDAVDQHTQEKVRARLLEAEYEENPNLDAVYDDAADSIADAVQSLKPRALGQVWLNVPSGGLFNSRSSMLNRLIATYLIKHRRNVCVVEGYASFERVEAGKFNVEVSQIRGSPPFESISVDHVIKRHGPNSKIIWEPFANIRRRTRSLERQWAELNKSQAADWTKEPFFEPDDFDPKCRRNIRVNFADKIGCVAVTSSKQPFGLGLAKRVGLSLEELRARVPNGRIQDRELLVDPIELHAIDAFKCAADYEHALRLLTDAEIAVFDLTGFESTSMVLLGVRAAVRRGVTIAMSSDDPRTTAIPFNLSTINLISLEANEPTQLADALEQAMASIARRPRSYLDLPVYDAVRKEASPRAPGEEILVLQWFDLQYEKAVRPIINGTLSTVFRTERSGAKVFTMLDMSSPQLVDQRLYSAIRRNELCVADLTGWRPNVLFEAGVRLAVNRNDPIFVLCSEQPYGWSDDASPWPDATDPGVRALTEFWQPIEFTTHNFDTLKSFFADLAERFGEEDLWYREGMSIWPGSTYDVLSDAIDVNLEPSGLSWLDLLESEAEYLAGPAVVEDGGLPMLYPVATGDAARRTAIEYQLMAWYALESRNSILRRVQENEIKVDDPVLLRVRQISIDLWARFQQAPRNLFKADRDHIDAARKKIDAYIRSKDREK